MSVFEEVDPEEGFQPPSGPPQIETEAQWDLTTLLDKAPAWEPSFAGELIVLFRNHVALRSAIGLAGELALKAQQALRTANDINEVKMLQGEINALERFQIILIDGMQSVEKPTENNNAPPH